MGVKRDPNVGGGKETRKRFWLYHAHLVVEDELLNAYLMLIFITFILPTLIPFG